MGCRSAAVAQRHATAAPSLPSPPLPSPRIKTGRPAAGQGAPWLPAASHATLGPSQAQANMASQRRRQPCTAVNGHLASEAGAALLAPIERVEPPPWAGHGAAAALSTAGQPKRRARHRRQHQQHTATAKRHRSATRHTASAAAAAGSDEDCSLPRWASNLGRHTGAPVGSWLVRSSTVNANCHQPRRWLKQKLNEKATT